MNRTTPERRAQILHLLCEGNSIRAVERLTGASKHTISKLLNEAGAICKETAPKTLSMLYVGETHEFDARVGTGFINHHKWAAAILGGATHICVLIIGGERANRLGPEGDLRQGNNPPLNDQ